MKRAVLNFFKATSVLLTVFVFVTMSSCSGLIMDGSTGSVSFEFSQEMLKAARDGDSGQGQPAFLLEAILKGKGNWQARQMLSISEETFMKNLNSGSAYEIKFKNIPVGKKLYAVVKIYTPRGGTIEFTEPAFIGKSEAFKVKKGDNSVAIKAFNYRMDFDFQFTIQIDNTDSPLEISQILQNLLIDIVPADTDQAKKLMSAGNDKYKAYDVLKNDSLPAIGQLYDEPGNNDIIFNTSGNTITVNGSLSIPVNEDSHGLKGKDVILVASMYGYSYDYSLKPLLYGSSQKLTPEKGSALSTEFTARTLDIIDTPVVTFDLTNPGYTNPKIDYSVNNQTFSDCTDYYCFDENGTFYVLSKGSSYYSLYSSAQSEPLSLGSTFITPDGFIYDNTAKKFYVYKKSTISLMLYDLTDIVNNWSISLLSQSISNVKTVKFSETTENKLSNFYHKIIAVNNGILYDVGNNNRYYDIKFVIADLKKYSALPASIAPDKVIDLGTPSMIDEKEQKITDLICLDDMVYLLYRENLNTIEDSYNPSEEYAVKSRGEIIRYNPLNDEITTLGWTNNKLSNNGKYFYAYTGSGTQLYYDYPAKNPVKLSTSTNLINMALPDLYSPTSKTAKLFFGPQKIIAIKPKKLVIADDGIMFYTDSENAYNYKNVNRIVTVDLEDFSISKTEMTDSTFMGESDKTSISSDWNYISSVFGRASLYLPSGSTTSTFNIGIPLGE